MKLAPLVGLLLAVSGVSWIACLLWPRSRRVSTSWLADLERYDAYDELQSTIPALLAFAHRFDVVKAETRKRRASDEPGVRSGW